jgi:hypothetical protein
MIKLKTNSIVKLCLSIVLCICFLQLPHVNADNISNNAAEFTISPIYPHEQKEDDVGYFDLNVKKSTTVPVKVKISNLNKNQDIEYLIKVGNATTMTMVQSIILISKIKKIRQQSINLQTSFLKQS